MAMGGPAGAAIGSGIGTLASGGDLEDAFKSGVMGFMGGQGGPMGGIMQAMGAGGQGGGGNQLAQIASMFGNQGGGGGNNVSQQGIGALISAMGGANNQMGSMANQGAGSAAAGPASLAGLNISNNPLMMAALLKATEPRDIKITSALQDRQLATGERDPSFRGVQAMDIRRRNPARFTSRPTYAQGGLIEGPGTGTSDSIPGVIEQNGKPVEEILVSNNEFILRAKDVEKIGEGDRDLGAAKLYAMQRRFDNGGTMNG